MLNRRGRKLTGRSKGYYGWTRNAHGIRCEIIGTVLAADA
jgi:hypothetical protein